MSHWRGLLAALLGAGYATAMAATDLPRITPNEAYRALARDGGLRHVQIDGDLDLSRMKPSPGVPRLTLGGVRVRGRLRATAGGPAVPVSFDTSVLQGIHLAGARLAAGLTLERSTVEGSARFDDSQFDGPFVLHGSVVAGKAVFRRARFGAPVEIVYTRFEEPAGMSGGVSFADTRFAAPARFDRSRFATDVRFDTSRFAADASFIALEVPGRASWRNVTFDGDAEFRFCRLGDVDFGDAEQMSVFNRLADFRGCTMRSARFDFADWRGDAMLVNLTVSPGDLTLRQAVLRGSRSDFSGLNVAGKLDLDGAYIAALHFRWADVAAPLSRAQPRSDVLRPLYHRLETLKQEDEARDAWALLAGQILQERLDHAGTDVAEKAGLWMQRLLWGWTTGYGTQLGRAALLSLAAWLVLSLPLCVWPRLPVGRWQGSLGDAPARHRAAAAQALHPVAASPLARTVQRLAYSFGLMFAIPALRLRPVQPLSPVLQAYLATLLGIGALLLALCALTLANVSPVFQAILGKIAG